MYKICSSFDENTFVLSSLINGFIIQKVKILTMGKIGTQNHLRPKNTSTFFFFLSLQLLEYFIKRGKILFYWKKYFLSLSPTLFVSLTQFSLSLFLFPLFLSIYLSLSLTLSISLYLSKFHKWELSISHWPMRNQDYYFESILFLWKLSLYPKKFN